MARFDQLDKRFDKLVNILEEQNIELYNIKSTLKKHDEKLDEMGHTIKKIHNQTARLSIGQSELNMKLISLRIQAQKKTRKISTVCKIT
ncbi:hypothetical protein DFR79_104126 [Halanaerobium saccharolyticum]|uniref:Uncharacterized protein n=1 Tax=Halanaerobium saccharolyticum TaxID=43595 RepID=A0A4R6M1C9_9FIRM|nr:hypothetical protein [Halanaerobium saccharolyticum]TDO94160.1 hypothetical protein DFR79_104126 [Halanaerobium saccharolyticum]